MEAIAHTKKSYAGTDKEKLCTQSLDDHLIGTTAYSESFAAKLDLPKCGRLAGLAHDIGKYSGDFQTNIRDERTKAKTVDHSTAGAQYITNNLPENAGNWEILTAKILSLIITGHHSGLMDVLSSNGSDNYKKRLDKCASETHIKEVTDKACYTNSNLEGNTELLKILEAESKYEKMSLSEKIIDIKQNKINDKNIEEILKYTYDKIGYITFK